MAVVSRASVARRGVVARGAALRGCASGAGPRKAAAERPAGKVRVRSGRPAMAPGAAVASFAGPWGACRRPRGP